MPAWITGLAFIAANLGALEILGQAANGAHYGVAAVHYYWLGAVPAMVFLGIVMMPFYYAAKVRSVPEYLRLRFNEATHAFNAATFAIANVHADLRRADALLGAEQAGHARAAGDARPGFGADPAGPGDVG